MFIASWSLSFRFSLVLLSLFFSFFSPSLSLSVLPPHHRKSSFEPQLLNCPFTTQPTFLLFVIISSRPQGPVISQVVQPPSSSSSSFSTTLLFSKKNLISNFNRRHSRFKSSCQHQHCLLSLSNHVVYAERSPSGFHPRAPLHVAPYYSLLRGGY
ncbi:MAG: hypothetical protein J3R72DRAFT_465069 [Linnemannia gamsii]|nr:MAG: hypothetical protein J3R72DRAFT_465069 [Linnemannia gamsii]